MGRAAARAGRGAASAAGTRWAPDRRSRCWPACIRRAAGILDGEPQEARREKLAARIGRHVPREIRERVTEFLGEIADVRFEDTQREALRAARANPQLMGDGMRRAFEDWLMAECAAHPVLLVLEDLHWGDSARSASSTARCATCTTSQPERAEVLFGGVDSVGAGSPFAMLARMIRRAAGILDGEPIETRREKLAARVGQHVAREIRERVTEFLGEIADVRFDDAQREALRAARANPQLMGDGMRRAFEDWLMAECAAHPVLLVLEDLHWGDLGTVSFLDSALRNLQDQPFMVLALARPEVEERFPDAVDGAPPADDPAGAAVAAGGRAAGQAGAGAASPRTWWRASSSAPTATPSTWRS